MGLRTPEDWEEVNNVSSVGQTLVILAARRGHMDILHYLVGEMKVSVCKLSENVAVLAKSVTKDCTPRDKCFNHILGALYADNKESLEYLLSHLREGEVDSQGEFGFTLLHYAATVGKLELVARLVNKYKANVDAASESGHKAVAYAVEHGHLEVVRFFLWHATKVGNKEQLLRCLGNEGKGMPLSFECANYNRTDMLKALVESGGVDLLHAHSLIVYVLPDASFVREEMTLLHYAAWVRGDRDRDR